MPKHLNLLLILCLCSGLGLADRTALAAPACPDPDQRATVIVGHADSGVTNYPTTGGCTVNDLIHDQQDWRDQRAFLNHVAQITFNLVSGGTLKAAVP